MHTCTKQAFKGRFVMARGGKGSRGGGVKGLPVEQASHGRNKSALGVKEKRRVHWGVYGPFRRT